MSHLDLNGTEPQLSLKNASYLESSNGKTIVPSRVSSDAFSDLKATPVMNQYLDDVEPLANGESTLAEDLSHHADVNVVRADVDVLGTDAASIEKNIESQLWPPSTDGRIALLKSELLRISMTAVAADSRISSGPLGTSDLHQLLSQLKRLHMLGEAVRTNLGLPLA
jgi:hypothetical protein